MKFLIEKTQQTFITVESDSPQEAIQKARDNEAIKSKPGTTVYFIRSPQTGGDSIGEIARKWPAILLPMKLLAKEGDRGAGDIIARVIGPVGGDAFKVWYKATFGKECNCGNRQEALNRRWPL